MPAEVLVMCPACARPQPSASACVHCGAALPEAPRPPGSSDALRPDPLLRPRAPAEVEVPLGESTRLFVGEDALELRGGDGSRERVALADVRRVGLERQRSWPLLAAAALPVLVAFALVDGWVIRLVLFVLGAGLAFLLLRREVLYLRIERVDAEPRRIRLGQRGSTGSATGVATSSRWAELSEELRRRGVDVQG